MIKKFDVQNLKIVLKTKEIKIEEAIPGQMVLAYDINNKKKCFRQITETHKPIVKKEYLYTIKVDFFGLYCYIKEGVFNYEETYKAQSIRNQKI